MSTGNKVDLASVKNKDEIHGNRDHKTMAAKTWEIVVKFHHVAGLFILAFLVSVLYLTRDFNCIYFLRKQVHLKKGLLADNNSSSQCDYFTGRWVYDNVSYPLYKENRCSFMEGAFACQKYGRKNLTYQNWPWQPHHCDLPRFNGKLLPEKIKGKRVIFVGDSLCRNQWVSMLCLIESSLPSSTKKMFNYTGNLQYFHINEHNTTIGFYWSPFLVESNCDDPWHHQQAGHMVRINSIENHARHWNDADILVFDSYAWWLNYELTIVWGSFGSPEAINKSVRMIGRQYEMALNTWSEWLEINVNRTKTKLFFMSASPYTLSRGETIRRHCYNVNEPVKEGGNWSRGDYRLMSIAESTVEKLEKRSGVKVNYLRITNLSEFRRDGHPSIYRMFYSTITQRTTEDPITYADCLHWCLPGVPDVWNQILYSYIIKS